MAQKLHARRTASKQAMWFLPHLRPNMQLLDSGCATGSITIGLAETVAPGQAIGVDISETEIELARERAASADISNLRFEVGDICELSYPDNYFDAVFCHSVLEHLQEPDTALREMYRVLKQDGVVGVRDTDMGGFLVAPNDVLLTRFLAIFEGDWAGVAGQPRIGRRLRGYLLEAGFVHVAVTASYEAYGDRENRHLMSQIIVNRIAETDFVERVTGRGLASTDELDAMRTAWLAWAERSDAFFATAHVEAVGHKA